ncbi:PEP-CTERM protein-sorting domain-containing protein [Nitrosospira sp. Nl5]|uniref:HAF repeat-containing PEP-CTERM protein n=1 Tax=Nitrosospira sp. Nl5 TaxID=200120 RepID=UPI000891AC5C|nr:HAF repeat-containing PEP-CTERM protein [Nitrosospira sp. Nl5]SCY57163.1 PEP-CTERM protein-sorting domain-containing protein [Nitrosospira sp. Nl5]
MIVSCCFKARSLILIGALVSGLGPGTLASAQERSFFVDLNSRTVTDLGSLYGRNITATAINDAGQLAGYHSLRNGLNPFSAFITGPDGMGMRDLGNLGGKLPQPYSSAYGINNSGQVAGDSYTAEGTIHAFITGPDGVGMRDLGTLEGSGEGHATGINNAGQVVGWAYTPEGFPHAFITGPNGMGMRDLGTLGGNITFATRINDVGQVVGESQTAEGNSHAFITGPDGMGMRDLGTFGDFSTAYGINNAGQVVGSSRFTSDGLIHAFITGPNDMRIRDLGTLGGDFSDASDINDAGQVVGRSTLTPGTIPSPGAYHVFITGPNGEGMMDLNSLIDLPEGVILTNAIDINNNGQVIATGIPEPETYALMLAGLGLIGFIAGRKKSEVRI